MPPTVVVDSGPLVAAFNRRDRHHEICARLLSRTDLEFVIPVLCAAESAQLVAARGGWRSEAAVLRAFAALDIRPPLSSDWDLIAAEVERYSSFDIGAVDASVVVLAEHLETDTIATLDHRHFRAIRPRYVEAFTLLPEL